MNELQKAAAILGKKGGESGTGEAKARSTKAARQAALTRWGGLDGKKKRFWEKVKKGGPDECWPWTAAKFRTGYGAVMLFGRNQCAHRVSFLFTFGHLDPEKQVCHKCDNPPCCNPNHLFEGTMADNVHDSMKKGRRVYLIGAENGNKKLDEASVLKIRKHVADGTATILNLAKEYGVHHTCIRMLIKRKTWRHI